MIAARDEGLIGGAGLSNISRGHLLHALDRTPIACVQNPSPARPNIGSAGWLSGAACNGD